MKRLRMILCAVLLLPAAAQSQDAPPGDAAALVQGGNAFAADLYLRMHGQDGNLFFSPLSIYTGLAMAYAGSDGKTADEMAEALHFTLPQERLHPAMAQLLSGLNTAGAGDNYQLYIANALWAQKDYTFRADFLQCLSDNYDAGVNLADFKNAAEPARQAINHWVEMHTAQKIVNLLPSPLPPATRLVLASAVYFKGSWQAPFDKNETHDEDFYLNPVQHVKARLMHQTGSFNYFHGRAFQVLELPYQDNVLSMIILLPDSANGLPILEQAVNPATLAGWLDNLRPAPKVIVTLPKFRIESQFDLGGMLRQLGMAQAFDAKTADFSGMSDAADQDRLYLSAVLHKAYVDVDEEGTEAAAATGEVMAVATAMRREPPTPVFRADHPFLFLIRDNQSGSILFMGRMANPSPPA